MMNPSSRYLENHVFRLPAVAMLIATVVGIVLSTFVTLPLWALVASFVVAIVVAWLLLRSRWSDLYLCVALALLASISVEITRKSTVGELSDLYEIEVESIISQGEEYLYGKGVVIATYNTNKPIPCRMPIRIYADSTAHISAGQRVLAVAHLRRFSPFDSNSYNRYNYRQGVVGQLYLSSEDILCRDTLHLNLGESIRYGALERLSQLDIAPSAMALSSAITLGQRQGLSAEVREAFRRSGNAHLLAVSGLHVGFVCIVVSLLLGLLLLLPAGQVVRSVVVVAVIWIYVAVVGFSPSVVRAAVMFSLLQIIVTLSSWSRPLNRVALAATLILLFSPYMLWDVGFVLSVLAVVGIVEWGVPIIAMVKQRLECDDACRYRLWYRLVNLLIMWFVSAVVVSVVASVATMPLVACIFGLTSLWGIVTGPVMVLLCGVLMGCSLLWILLPCGALSPFFGGIIEGSASAMNSVAAWCAERGALIFEGEISVVSTIIIYVSYLVVTLLLWRRR